MPFAPSSLLLLWVSLATMGVNTPAVFESPSDIYRKQKCENTREG